MRSPCHPGDTIFPNDTEQFDWSKFFKTKIEGFWLTVPRDTPGEVMGMVIDVAHFIYSVV